MAVELGDALDHAHAQGVVHRDVKPSNVLLRRDGVTKLVDLGIATAAGHTRITGSGVVLGTAAYMAPEQLDGRPAESPADVYAFSCVCFEALSGRRAREGRTAIEIAHRIATEPPPDLREALPEASPAAAALLARGMARDPADTPGLRGRARAGAAPGAGQRAGRRGTAAAASPRPRRRRADGRRYARGLAGADLLGAGAAGPPGADLLGARAGAARPAPCAGPAWPRSCWLWPRSRWGPPCSPECSRRGMTGARTARRLIARAGADGSGQRTEADRADDGAGARRRPPSPASRGGPPETQPAAAGPAAAGPAGARSRKTRRPRNRRPHRRTGRP